MRFWYLRLRFLLVCPTYAIWYVLHVSYYIPLLSSSCVLLGLFLICVLLNGVGSLERHPCAHMCKEVCNFSCFWAVVGEGNPFLVFIMFFLASSFLFNLLFKVLYEFLRKVFVLCN